MTREELEEALLLAEEEIAELECHKEHLKILVDSYTYQLLELDRDEDF